MSLVTGLLDRLLFAAALILFMQIPQFVDHYTQRFGGYRQAVAASVADYERSADLHYEGNLALMIHEFKADERPAVRDLGNKMERERHLLDEMTDGLAILEQAPLIDKLWYLARRIDMPIARATFDAFTPGLPLNLDALVCGLTGSVLVSALFNLLLWPLRRLASRQPELRI